MLPKEVTKFIGQSMDISIFEVGKEAIRRFADAIDDPNPLYWDEEYAKKSRYGSIIAPPGFISSPWFSGRPTKWGRRSEPSSDLGTKLRSALTKAGYTNPGGVDAGIEYEFCCPVRAGDTLTASSTLKDIIEREGRTGKLAFMVIEITYTNQNGDLVAKARATHIQR